MVGEEVGTVEKIGIRTTRLRSLSGEQIIFPNADLLGGRIRNFKSLQERRILFTIGVVYGTPNDKLAAIPDMIRQIIESQDMTRFDRAHFKTFGDSALQFEIVYYVLRAEYGLFMDVQQAINLEINRRFVEQGIEFAYPTQTLFVNTLGSSEGTTSPAQ